MKELRYEIINTAQGLTERYVLVHDDGTEEVKGEKKLNTDDMLGIFCSRMPKYTDEIKRGR